MSRYELKPKDPNHVAVIGWNWKHGTFFAEVQVIDLATAKEHEKQRDVLWEPGDKTITDAHVITRLIHPYIEMNQRDLNDLTAKLEDDRIRTTGDA